MPFGRTRHTYHNSVAKQYFMLSDVGAVQMTLGEFRPIAFMMAAPLPGRRILVERASATNLFSPRH